MAVMFGLLLAGAGSVLGSEEFVTNRFGFLGKEIFPIEHQISHLRAVDLDGDGLLDLVVVNNARSRINLLLNQTGRTNDSVRAVRTRRELNELPPDARFRIESIASEKRISSLVAADLNGDGRPDLAYYGDPRELIVQYNEGANGWSAPRRWPIEDGLLTPNALASGDLNGDGREDLVLLADGHLYWLAQDERHQLGEPQRIQHSGSAHSVHVVDLQGDGRGDLLLANPDSATPFRFRLQNASGQLGPEMHFTLQPVRAFRAGDLNGDGRAEFVTIAQKSGRAQIARFMAGDAVGLADPWVEGQLHVAPLSKTSRARRGLLWADVNGDGRSDLLVSEPENGQLVLQLQEAGGGFQAPRSFATLTGVSDIAVAGWEGGNSLSIFVLSSDERQVGVTRLDDMGRIAFPRILPLEGRPLALTTGMLHSGQPARLVLIVEQDGRRELQIRSSRETVHRQKLREDFKGTPASITVHDVNQDGLEDLVILVPYEKAKVLLQVAGGDFAEVDLTPPGGAAEQPWLTIMDVDGDGKPELLLAQRNFLRAVVLEADPASVVGWAFTVKEQINGAASNSRLIGAASLRPSEGAMESIFLLDAERKALTLCQRDETGSWKVVRNMPLPYWQFSHLQSIALDADQPNAIGFLGSVAAGWMPLSGPRWEFVELDGYETPITDAFLREVAFGDLNQDGQKDLVFLETARNYIDLVTFENHQLSPANRWQVFEERTFRNRRSDSSEPREAVVADLTGDGKSDLAVLVHDRVVVYVQE